MIRMKSPDGGFTHAYSKDEEERLRSYGWIPEKEIKPAEPQPEIKPPGRPRKAK